MSWIVWRSPLPSLATVTATFVYWKRKAEKKETEERLEKQRAEKQEQEERQYNLKIDGKDVTDLTGKMVELLGTSTSIGVMENGVSTFDVLA